MLWYPCDNRCTAPVPACLPLCLCWLADGWRRRAARFSPFTYTPQGSVGAHQLVYSQGPVFESLCHACLRGGTRPATPVPLFLFCFFRGRHAARCRGMGVEGQPLLRRRCAGRCAPTVVVSAVAHAVWQPLCFYGSWVILIPGGLTKALRTLQSQIVYRHGTMQTVNAPCRTSPWKTPGTLRSLLFRLLSRCYGLPVYARTVISSVMGGAPAGRAAISVAISSNSALWRKAPCTVHGNRRCVVKCSKF